MKIWTERAHAPYINAFLLILFKLNVNEPICVVLLPHSSGQLLRDRLCLRILSPFTNFIRYVL